MFEQILTPRSTPVVTPEQLASFGRFDLPQVYATEGVYTDDYQLLLTFIEAATDEVENMAATACLYEQVLLTFDCFPDRHHHDHWGYEFSQSPWWWQGHRSKDSIELVRRPVVVPAGSPVTNNVIVNYYAPDGTLQTLSPATYTVFGDKITLNVGQCWPCTDRRQDCVQVTYWAGYDPSDPTNVPARLTMAILYLANHMQQVRQIVSVEETSEVSLTLCRMLSSFRSMRIPR